MQACPGIARVNSGQLCLLLSAENSALKPPLYQISERSDMIMNTTDIYIISA